MAPTSQGAWMEATGLVDLNPGPVVQFKRSCARCHGSEGSLFGERFSRIGLPQLRHEMIEMMAGRGRVPTTPGMVGSMFAYLLAIRQKVPFVVVDNAAAFTSGQDTVLHGEVSPGASVHIVKNGQVIPVPVEGLAWSLTDPPAVPFSIVAGRDDRQVRFPFPLQQWSVPPTGTLPVDQYP